VATTRAESHKHVESSERDQHNRWPEVFLRASVAREIERVR